MTKNNNKKPSKKKTYNKKRMGTKTTKKKTNKTSKKTNNFFQILLIIILGFILYGGIFSYVKMHIKEDINIIPAIFDNQNQEDDKKQKENDYNNCLNRVYDERDYDIETLNIKQEISNFIKSKNYQVSIYYEDILTGFTYTYNPKTIYYGCSLIKLVDALYLINKAIVGEIDLDKETITYTANYKASDSIKMAKRKIGEKVSLRDLIDYAISVSDNTAHFMLIDYIGINNLKAYGKSLGAKVILTGGDSFGNQTAEDTNIYLKEAYKIINENSEYGPFLKKIMDNNERNAFNKENIKIYHKYGSYGPNYHDIGLSLENYPYTISILTLHENKNYIEVVQNIHEKIIRLHNEFHKNREDLCYREIYEA